MRKYQVQLEGVAPLRMNKFIDMKMPTRPTEIWLIEDAHNRCYIDEKKHYYIPKNAFKAVVLNGATKVRLGRGRAKSDMKAVFFVQNDGILKHSKPIITKEIVRIPPGPKGARVPKYFVIFETWSVPFEILITDDNMPEEVIKDSIIAGGMYFGFLDGRPDYGRFILKEFETIK